MLPRHEIIAMPHAVHAAIGDAVDRLRGDLVSLLQRIVRTPSVSGSEQAAQQVMQERYVAMGLDVERVTAAREALERHPAFSDDGIPFDDRVSLVARWRARETRRDGGRSLILNGHIDVVPPGDEAAWTDGPFSGAIRDGRLYGRGACDMKAGLCASATAVRALQSIGFEPDADVILQSVIAEECGGIGTLSTIVHGVRADACVITEPTSLRIWTAQSGALTFRITVSGRAAHGAMKSKGVNAVVAFMPILERLEQLDVERHRAFRHPLYDDPTNVAPISVGIVRAGDWPSTVPDVLVAEGRFGVFPGESAADARRALAEALAEVSSSHPWLAEHPPVLEWFEGQFDSAEVSADGDIVTALRAAHDDSAPSPVMLGAVSAGTDARLFTRYADVPAILYGPGDIDRAHTVDEFVEIDEVVQCAKTLAHLIVDWCSAGVPRSSKSASP